MEMRIQSRICDLCDRPQTPMPESEKERHYTEYKDDNRRDREDSTSAYIGILPQRAYLANPFVPFQPNDPPTYSPQKGAVRGTLFPGLDLPYRGMVNEGKLNRTHLQELQALAFAITELGEYLDTHSDDREAFSLMQSYVKLYEDGKTKYEALHGPLTQKAAASMDSYQWLRDPWPWDYEANQIGG